MLKQDGVTRFLGRMTRLVPEPLLLQLLPIQYRWNPTEMTIVQPPLGKTRVFIGPVNSAGQATRWARAIETYFTEAGAISMAYTGIGEFGYEIDQSIPATGYVLSKSWQSNQKLAVEQGFTHVLVEAERHLFGRVFDQTVAQQVNALLDAGVNVAFISHGSDLRLPSRHAASEPFSPFSEGQWEQTPLLEAEAAKNRALIDELDIPVFISTLGLIEDAPEKATWLPVVVDPEVWQPGPEILVRDVPVVVHAPSKGVVKGTSLIEPVMKKMHEAGIIDYRPIAGVPASAMPQVYREADIVLDQFRLGDYGVAACEAMAAERLVVGHVSETVRNEVRKRTQKDLPIVQATPSTLESAIQQVIDNRELSRRQASLGREFVINVHNGRRSASALAPFLGRELLDE